MADTALIEKVQDLSDLELAALICLIAQEHCIIDTEPDIINDLAQELELIASKVFGLSHAIIDCSEHTTLDDFANSIVAVSGSPDRSDSPTRTRPDGYFLNHRAFNSIARSPLSEGFGESKSIANVLIAKNLDEAPKPVQIQALELLRTKRIYTRTSVQSAPKRFLFIVLLGGGAGPRLTKHLNDFMFISHFHAEEDEFPNLEELYNDTNSISSVVKKGYAAQHVVDNEWPRITASDIERLTQLSAEANVSVEVKQYQQNIISFLRIHRAVAGGVSPSATKHFDKLARCLAPLHNLTYATPSLMALAARKIYLHRLEIVTPERERSMQWGSDVDAIAAILEGIGPEDVIEDVLGTSGAEAPL